MLKLQDCNARARPLVNYSLSLDATAEAPRSATAASLRRLRRSLASTNADAATAFSAKSDALLWAFPVVCPASAASEARLSRGPVNESLSSCSTRCTGPDLAVSLGDFLRARAEATEVADVLALLVTSEPDEVDWLVEIAVRLCGSRRLNGGAGDDVRDPRLLGAKDRISSSFSDAVLSWPTSKISLATATAAPSAKSRFPRGSKLSKAQSAVRSKKCLTLGSSVTICMKLWTGTPCEPQIYTALKSWHTRATSLR